jgi:hypothetical protein
VWQEPVAKDNHDKAMRVIKTGAVAPGDKLLPGTYPITYEAKDSAGNKAFPCNMKIVVKGNCVDYL